MKKVRKSSEYGIIGIGRFGEALAKTLAEAEEGVLIIDRNEEKIKKLRNQVQEGYVIKKLTREALEETGIDQCGTVIVCVGDIDASILTVLDLINMGVPRVIAKAKSNEHGSIIEKLGADAVFPEKDTAVRLAGILIQSKAIDLMELNDGYIVSEIKIPKSLDGITIKKLGLHKYDIKMIALEKDPKTFSEFKEGEVLQYNDAIVLLGKFGEIELFEREVIRR